MFKKSRFKKTIIIFFICLIITIITALCADELPFRMSSYYYNYVELSSEFNELDFDEYHLFYKWSEYYDLDIRLVISVAMTESNLNHYARHKRNLNKTIDYGIMGINSAHGEKEELMDMNNNIKFGCSYLKRCLESSDDLHLSIGRYNAGINSKWKNVRYAEVVLAYY